VHQRDQTLGAFGGLVVDEEISDGDLFVVAGQKSAIRTGDAPAADPLLGLHARAVPQARQQAVDALQLPSPSSSSSLSFGRNNCCDLYPSTRGALCSVRPECAEAPEASRRRRAHDLRLLLGSSARDGRERERRAFKKWDLFFFEK
jgi:hypothetical protein